MAGGGGELRKLQLEFDVDDDLSLCPVGTHHLVLQTFQSCWNFFNSLEKKEHAEKTENGWGFEKLYRILLILFSKFVYDIRICNSY